MTAEAEPIEASPTLPQKPPAPSLKPRSLRDAEIATRAVRERLQAAEVVLERARESAEHARTEAVNALASGRKRHVSLAHISRQLVADAELDVSKLKGAVAHADAKLVAIRAKGMSVKAVAQLDVDLEVAVGSLLSSLEGQSNAVRSLRAILWKSISELGTLDGVVELGTYLAVIEQATTKITRVVENGAFEGSRWRRMD